MKYSKTFCRKFFTGPNFILLSLSENLKNSDTYETYITTTNTKNKPAAIETVCEVLSCVPWKHDTYLGTITPVVSLTIRPKNISMIN